MGVADKKERAVLVALAAAVGGLLRGDMREATRREVSSHTVHEQLETLEQRGHIVATHEPSTDGRVKGMLDRYTITEAGRQAIETEESALA